MTSRNAIFSLAKPLEKMNEKKLFETYHYNLDYEHDKLWFSSIAKNFNITKIIEVNNSYLYGMYLLCKEELLYNRFGASKEVEEIILYHSTSSKNAESIARNNIDWRKTKRSKYGKGACFAPDPLYASHYSSSHGAFVVFHVLVKNIDCIPGVCYSLRVPTDKIYDTTLGNFGKVYVKYDDFQFYPQYIVYHD